MIVPSCGKVSLAWGSIKHICNKFFASKCDKEKEILEITGILAHLKYYSPSTILNAFESILNDRLLNDNLMKDRELLVERFASWNSCLMAIYNNFFDLESASLNEALKEKTRDDCLQRLLIVYHERNKIEIKANAFKDWLINHIYFLGKEFSDGIVTE